MAEIYESEKWVRGKAGQFYKVSQKVKYLEPYLAERTSNEEYRVRVEDSIPTDNNGGILRGVIFNISCEVVGGEGSNLKLIVQNDGKIGTGTGYINQYAVSVPSLSGYDLDWSNTWAQFYESKTMTVICADSASPTAAGRLHAISFSGTIPEKYITGNMIANNTIKAANLANNSVTTAKLNSGAVVAAKIADGAVTTDKLADGAVTARKISEFVDLVYPVGSYYETSDVSFNPNTTWGGTWVEDSTGYVTIATTGSTGGTTGSSSEYISTPRHTHDATSYHTGSITHSHTPDSGSRNFVYANGDRLWITKFYVRTSSASGFEQVPILRGSTSESLSVGQTGWTDTVDSPDVTTSVSYAGFSSVSVSHYQPSIYVRRWHRTA